MTLDELRRHWSEILDRLERNNRVAWLAFFDARLASLHSQVLALDFSDSQKFAAPLEYARVRDPLIPELQRAIFEVTGEEILIKEES